MRRGADGPAEDLDAIKEGLLASPTPTKPAADLIFNVDMVRRAWGAQNKDTLVRFVRAMAASYAFMNDPQTATRS